MNKSDLLLCITYIYNYTIKTNCKYKFHPFISISKLYKHSMAHFPLISFFTSCVNYLQYYDVISSSIKDNLIIYKGFEILITAFIQSVIFHILNTSELYNYHLSCNEYFRLTFFIFIVFLMLRCGLLSGTDQSLYPCII